MKDSKQEVLDLLTAEAVKEGGASELEEAVILPVISFGDEGSQNLYRPADEEILRLVKEIASYSETEEEEVNIRLLAKFAKDGNILFNFQREYIVTSEEVGNWLAHHQECKRALYALTLFNE